MMRRLTTRLATVLALLGGLSAGLTGWYVYDVSRGLMVEAAQSKLLTATRVMVRRITTAREAVTRDLKLLAQHPDTLALASGQSADAQKRLEALYGIVMQSNSSYLQVRLIGQQAYGLERVRVDRHDGKPLTIDAFDMQEKGHFDYVSEALKVPVGDTYISRIVINREAGVHAGEGKPTVIMAMPVRGGNGVAQAVVVINIDLQGLFDQLGADLPSSFQLFLTNGLGDWLVHPDSSLTFGFDRGQRHLVQDDMPPTLPLVTGLASEAVFETVQAGQSLVAAFVAQSPVVVAQDARLMFGLAQPLRVVLADVEQLRAAIWQIVLAVGVACLLVAWLVARTLARPINDVGAAARRFAQGQGIGSLPTDRSDEIGELARSFQRMHDTLEQQMSALELSKQELSDLARHDGLTGLANRRLFHENLQNALAQRRRNGQVVALLYLDLDRFKQINDTHGHDAGDAVLKAVAQRLRANTREVDTPARLGGDEFAVVVAQSPNDEQLALVADKLVRAVSAPIAWQDQYFVVGCSMGIARTPADGEGEEPLMLAADAAMYTVKQTRQGGYRFHSPVDMASQANTPGKTNGIT